MSLTKVSFSMITGATVNVLDFGADPTGVANSASAIQAALDFAQGNYVVHIPAGTYKLTAGLVLYKGTQLTGDNNRAGNEDYAAGAGGTKLVFEPAAPADLFNISNLPAPPQSFRSMIGVSGIWVVGDGGTNSRYAITSTDMIYCSFANLKIEGFQTAVYFAGTPIDNIFRDLYISNCTTACVEYRSAGTTDTWDHCVFRYAPIGVVIEGGISYRFTNCLFEALDTYGVDIDKESRGIQFTNCYAEDVPYTNTATGAMFKVGYSGVTASLQTSLQVVGGSYAGRNAGIVGSFLDADEVVGVQLAGVFARYYTNLIKTTAATSNYAIACSSIQFNSCTNTYTDITKVSGTIDILATNAAAGPIIRGNALQGNSVSADTFSLARELKLIDGVGVPATESGFAFMYVDSADGDLKVKFGDGTVKTIATDT